MKFSPDLQANARPVFSPRSTLSYPGQAVPRARDPGSLHQLTGQTMGTSWSVKFDNPRLMPLNQVRTAIDTTLERIVRQMSTWESGSAIRRYNAAAAGSWQVLAPEFWKVLQRALHWAELTQGAFDPTVGPLVALWGFGSQAAGAPRQPPAADAFAQARSRAGWRRLSVQAERQRVCQPGGLALDLSGIAKGFAVDQLAGALQALAVQDFIVEVGGELFARGRRPDGLPWRVALPHEGTLVLSELAVATSGDAWHAWEHAGRRYSHSLDPRSGEPVQHALHSVTVAHAQCMDADALATALLVLGPQDGMAFAQDHGLAACFLLQEEQGPRAVASPAFSALPH